MPPSYLAFDIETARDVPGEEFNWRAHRPLGISCAATLTSTGELRHWHGKSGDASPAPRMSRAETLEMLAYLEQMTAEGFTVLTWNGLGFDFDVLAEECGAVARCRDCALGHVDMMFHVVCALGYPIGLDRAAKGMGLPGKPEGMSGELAPQLWARGQFQKVLDYVAQDVRVAMDIAQSSERRGRLEWLTRKGTVGKMPLPKGWLSVHEAMKLPLPDTSWMKQPLPRADFTGWFAGA